MTYTVRLAKSPADYIAIAAVLDAENEGGDMSVEELAEEDAARLAQQFYLRLVAEVLQDGQPFMVGLATASDDLLAYRPGKFDIDLRVHPNWQGRGVGKALYAALCEALAQESPTELVTSVWHKLERPIRFLSERGFVESWRRVDSVLNLAEFDAAPYVGWEEKLTATGVLIKTYDQLADDPNRLSKLHELDWALWQAIPFGQAVSKRSLQQFAAQEVDHPKFIADACFVAVVDGEFVGYSNLSKTAQGFNTEMTGVLSSWRGLGIATALKLAGIRYAQQHNGERLETQNDSVNQAMLALNHKLGFVEEGASLRFVKRMD